MARFDVYARPSWRQGAYLVDVQANLLSHLETRAVVPLVPEDPALRPTPGLNPFFVIAGRRCMFAPQSILTVARPNLRHPVASLAAHRDDITRALDTLFTGF